MTARETAQPDAARRRLAQSRVLIVGVGALGCPAALHLAAAGIGSLVLLDPDRVELSNLHRQILHRTSSIGTEKVASAAARIGARFPAVRIETQAAAPCAANVRSRTPGFWDSSARP